MQVVARPQELRERVAHWRRHGERIALVPTMGNLHPGHGSLVAEALRRAERVIVSVFVNPLQFGPNEDFASYPRTPQDDRELLEQLRVEMLFVPEVEDIYPRGQVSTARVHVPALEDILCGAYRPGHFMGVATVVTKLLNIVQPDVALFGEKDFQQLMIIRRAVTDLYMPVEIVGVPTAREADGLAMSSRNRYLTPEQRVLAPRIYAELSRARAAIEAGGEDYATIERSGYEALQQAGFRPDYFSVRDAATLADPGMPKDSARELVILTAARIGRARLIDNIRVRPRTKTPAG
ncbi:pantoate--beta-alanine ligase [Steroidobacter denitrificans]|uniref:Pantothenate synthetase n=1 Tax=Steroidobacter denitrificans TaxID=465721 RepID=A0A127F7C6_STEDE|nr:pantoate--beta-alanine ligase [Steroidobacter denitrificans]AMN46346.1 pantoate--beta-alanine ligase [Steroidobacter denitrificans]